MAKIEHGKVIINHGRFLQLKIISYKRDDIFSTIFILKHSRINEMTVIKRKLSFRQNLENFLLINISNDIINQGLG